MSFWEKIYTLYGVWCSYGASLRNAVFYYIIKCVLYKVGVGL